MNPIYGSVGLLWSGSWQLCQDAVEAVLKGAPITQIATDADETKNGPPLKAYDIRHVSREDKLSGSGDVLRVRNRYRFKRSKRSRVRAGPVEESGRDEATGSPSHGSSLSHQSEAAEPNVEMGTPDSESLASADNAKPDHGAEPDSDSAREDDRRAGDGEIELDLTLGFEPFKRSMKPRELAVKRAVGCDDDHDDGGFCKMELGLDYAAL